MSVLTNGLTRLWSYLRGVYVVVRPAESVTTPLSMDRTIDVLADPAKMISFLALSTFPDRQKVGFVEFARRVNELQGDYPSREVQKANVISHCKNVLIPAGVAEFADPNLVPDSKTAHAVGVSERRADAALAISGAMLGLQLDVPHKGFLETTMSIRSDTQRDNPRIAIYKKLTEDGPSSVMDIARAADISAPRTTNFVQVLCESGVLTHHSLIDRANRKYLLAAGDFPVTTKVSPTAQAVIDAALTLREQGHGLVTAQALLDEVSRQRPRLPQRVAWEALRVWLEYKPHRSGLIRPVERGKAKSKISITEAFEPYIKKLLETRELLLGTDAEALAFQAEARQNAEEIIRTPELVSQILAYKTGYSAEDNRWTQVADDIYMRGVAAGHPRMSLEEMHRQAVEKVGRQVSLRYFCAQITRSPSLVLRAHTEQTLGSRLQKYIVGKLPAPKDWSSQAACNTEDPELFFPLNTTAAFVDQANKAKKICHACPVKLPCLKTAIDNGTTSGISGGVWLDQPGELTPELRELTELVTITPRRTA